MSILAADKEYIWHPFTQMKLADPPVHIVRAEGCYLYDKQEQKYLDGISSWWVNIHGHAHPHIAESLTRQALEIDHIMFAGFTHEPAVSLAEKLLNILPQHFSKVFYSDNGSTTVEIALKMGLQYWKNKNVDAKNKIIAFEDAYHGDTFGAMSVGERSAFNAAFKDFLFDVERLPLPNDDNIEKCIQQFTVLAKSKSVAAFIFEPLVLGAGGMRMYKAEYLDRLLSIAKENDIICIADEVMTGFGRTGKNFACEYLSNKPDIICLSKGITGGILPLAVTICTGKIFDAFYSDEATKALFHGHSYTANPIACAAALASMELLIDDSCQKQIQLITDHHRLFLQKIKDDPFIKDVRCTGTILAIEIQTTEGTSYFHHIKEDAYKFFMDNGVLLRPLGNVIYFMPPYCITKEELEQVYKIISDGLLFLKKKYYKDEGIN